MSEWKHIITEWLSEYAALQPNEIKSFAAEHEHNHEIASALFNMLYNENDQELQKYDNDEEYAKILEDVCTQLFSYYRSREVELQRFTQQFIPVLIYIYLGLSAQQTNKRICHCIETLLLGIYNFEVVDDVGKPKVVSFRLPSLAQSSIYHEPLSLGSQFLTESALRRWEDCNTKLVSWGPLPQYEYISAHNQLKVMSALLFIFNRNLSVIQKMSIRHFCVAVSRIVTQGFRRNENGSSGNLIPRIPVSSSFLLELVEGCYYAMFNEFYTLALQAINDINTRGEYELLPDVMLVTSAVLNSLKGNASGQPSDGPMGISVALSPATNTVTLSKSMITNASFRTKKLPDDIPIQVGAAEDPLAAISEEAEAEPLQRGGARTSKPKLSSFPGLGKKAAKDKGAGGTEKKVTLKDSSKAIWNTLSGGGDVDTKESTGSEANGSLKDEMSLASALNGSETSDSRSQLTTDSAELDAAPRFAAMQVSSV